MASANRWQAWVNSHPLQHSAKLKRAQLRRAAKWGYSNAKPSTYIHHPVGANWHTVEYVANFLNKNPDTIRRWCEVGFLIECGYKVMKIDSGSSRRWWIHIPPEQDNPPEPIVKLQQPLSQVDSLAI